MKQIPFYTFCLLLSLGYPAVSIASDIPDVAALTVRINQTPDDARLYVNRGRAFLRAGYWEAALSDAQKAFSLDQAIAGIQLLQGQAYLVGEDYEQAIIYLTRFLKITPTHSAAYRDKAIAHLKLSQYEAAYRDLLQAMELGAKSTSSLMLHFIEAARGINDPTKLKEATDLAIESRPESADVVNKAVSLVLSSADTDRALRYYDTAIKYQNEKAQWLYRKGELLEKLGRIDEAKATYEEALKHLPKR